MSLALADSFSYYAGSSEVFHLHVVKGRGPRGDSELSVPHESMGQFGMDVGQSLKLPMPIQGI